MEEKKNNATEVTYEVVEETAEEPKKKMGTRVKEAVIAKGKKVAEWTRENGETVKVLAPVVIAVAGGTVKIVMKLASKDRAKREKALKELYCYDRSLGHYWKLSRTLTSSEWLQVNQRRKDGESLGSIFSDMDVLK